MIEDMKLAGLAPTTQEIYLQAVRSLAKHYHRSPELLAEEEVRRYLLDVRERNARGSLAQRVPIEELDAVMAGLEATSTSPLLPRVVRR
jgi:hypothetical protein